MKLDRVNKLTRNPFYAHPHNAQFNLPTITAMPLDIVCAPQYCSVPFFVVNKLSTSNDIYSLDFYEIFDWSLCYIHLSFSLLFVLMRKLLPSAMLVCLCITIPPQWQKHKCKHKCSMKKKIRSKPQVVCFLPCSLKKDDEIVIIFCRIYTVQSHINTNAFCVHKNFLLMYVIIKYTLFISSSSSYYTFLYSHWKHTVE